MFRIVPLSDIKARWDAFVDSSDEAWLWHKSDLIQILTSWPGRTDISFALLDSQSDEIFAILPLHRISNSKFGISLVTFNSLGWLALRNRLDEHQTEELLKIAFVHLKTLSNKEKSSQFDFALSPVAPAYRQKHHSNFPKFPSKPLEVSTQTYVLDLSLGKEHAWTGFEKRARNAIRKAENLGVNIRPANHTSDLDAYYDLHKSTYNRTGVTPHPIEYFDGIWKYFYSKGLAHILFAEVDGQVVAAETFGVYKNAANYWTGAANEKGLACNANSLIQWHAILHFIDIGLKFYDIGEAFPDSVSGKQRGLDLFKRSFGGTLYPLFRGRIVTRKSLYFMFKFFNIIRGKA